MNSMLLMALLLMVVGFFIILKISPIEILDYIKNIKTNKKESIRQKVLSVTQKKKSKGIKRLVEETREILRMTGKENRFFITMLISVIASVIGIFFALLMNNMLLIPILSIGFALIPFWYVKLVATKWKNELNDELETALSVITTSYMRSDSIITAIEENIDYINPPVDEVFKSFMMDSKLINANIKMALEKLRSKIDSDVFRQWVDAIIDCQEDKNLKSTLTPIVTKLSDMRIVSGELNNMLHEPIKEFMMMASLLIGNIPLIYFLNKDWYHSLMFTPIGKGVLGICTVVLFISIAGVVKQSKPVEYRR
ncbi:type II secretion system F family protein [Maledivibacter halophilus]|uniref:Flp pilus assembly protein TadB n=1 Tax=Maledivibacter halophilus TaxID=36842 RepID=A0A1T5LQ35_9FIRM|nr:hypothetical protein [Maledivibacter halophilus]SKC77669.1 Flp pilus assembly protein TadB [Maledivibacter halophilus]